MLTIGKFCVADVFDTNKYAHDPRGDFMNWSIIDTGTFDYAADAWGYTYGAPAEWYQGDWTVRGGLFDLSSVPNSIDLDTTLRAIPVGRRDRAALRALGAARQARGHRVSHARSDGQLRGRHRAGGGDRRAGRHRAVRQYNSRGGISMNLEQQITAELGLFARAGCADGDIEPYEFTDVDRTAAAGLSLAGKQWGRPDDTFGIAGVVNGITKVHEQFLNDGGLGILVGDGMLPHPGIEQIIETYYTLPVSYFKLTLDYQFIVNPGYNEDRGPASVIGARLHSDF